MRHLSLEDRCEGITLHGMIWWYILCSKSLPIWLISRKNQEATNYIYTYCCVLEGSQRSHHHIGIPCEGICCLLFFHRSIRIWPLPLNCDVCSEIRPSSEGVLYSFRTNKFYMDRDIKPEQAYCISRKAITPFFCMDQSPFLYMLCACPGDHSICAFSTWLIQASYDIRTCDMHYIMSLYTEWQTMHTLRNPIYYGEVDMQDCYNI